MPAPGALAGLTVVTFESRRGDELARLLERHEAAVVRAPALQEIPIADAAPARALADALEADRVAALVLLTGVGTRGLVKVWSDAGLAAPPLLARTRIVARGPKPVAALREIAIDDAIRVDTPHTWREVLATIDGLALAPGSTIAVLEYGAQPTALLDGLRARGHRVESVPVYRWALPRDVGPLRAAAVALGDGTAQVALFTSAVQVEHLFRVAPDPEALRRGVHRILVASIGPTCSEALDAHGLAPDLEADPPKLGPLVALVAERARRVLLDKG